MIIDTHTHVWPDKVAEKAREFLEHTFRTRLVTVPTLSNLLRFMDQNGIDISVIAAVASRPDQVRAINEWILAVRDDRLRVFAAFHPGYTGWRDELSRVADCAAGIKLQPEFQGYYVDDESVFPVYEELQRLGLPVLIHCGEELSGTMVVRSSPDRVAKVHGRFPGLKLIAAHFGGFRMWNDVGGHLVGRDVFLDTAFTFGHLDEAVLKEFLSRHPRRRVLFGTDFPLVDQVKDIRYLEGLDIDEEYRERIFFRNAQELLNLKP